MECMVAFELPGLMFHSNHIKADRTRYFLVQLDFWKVHLACSSTSYQVFRMQLYTCMLPTPNACAGTLSTGATEAYPALSHNRGIRTSLSGVLSLWLM